MLIHAYTVTALPIYSNSKTNLRKYFGMIKIITCFLGISTTGGLDRLRACYGEPK
jgi:hypothetical protein